MVNFKIACFLQVPDFLNSKIDGVPVKEVISDTKWLEEEFTQMVQNVHSQVTTHSHTFYIWFSLNHNFLSLEARWSFN